MAKKAPTTNNDLEERDVRLLSPEEATPEEAARKMEDLDKVFAKKFTASNIKGMHVIFQPAIEMEQGKRIKSMLRGITCEEQPEYESLKDAGDDSQDGGTTPSGGSGSDSGTGAGSGSGSAGGSGSGSGSDSGDVGLD